MTTTLIVLGIWAACSLIAGLLIRADARRRATESLILGAYMNKELDSSYPRKMRLGDWVMVLLGPIGVVLLMGVPRT